MSQGLNKVMLIGNLGADPELKYTQGNQAVLKLRLATSESWMPKDGGERQTRTEWHTVIVWGKRAEGLNRVLAKGKTIYVEGRIQSRSWEDQNGQKRFATDIVATDVLLLGGGQRRDGGGGAAGDTGADDFGAGGGYGDDTDIPFATSANIDAQRRRDRIGRAFRW